MYNFFNLRNFRNGCYMGYHCILIVAVRVSMEERLPPGGPKKLGALCHRPACPCRRMGLLTCLLHSHQDIARLPPQLTQGHRSHASSAPNYRRSCQESLDPSTILAGAHARTTPPASSAPTASLHAKHRRWSLALPPPRSSRVHEHVRHTSKGMTTTVDLGR
jgi:hypothetical protein